MTVRIDEAKVFRLIEEKRPRAILVNAPGGLLRQTKDLMERVRETICRNFELLSGKRSEEKP